MDFQTAWYGVIALSILMYAMLDGFDLGVGALHLFARGDLQRRIFLNSIGPVWDGNEVWVVIVLGGLFAGFPNVYATVMSGFYTLLMFLIAGLIFRAVAIECRSKHTSPIWRSSWDWAFSCTSILVAFVLGLLIGNLIKGVPLDANQDYMGTFFDLFRPYPILIGVLTLSLFAMHGSIYLHMKTDGEAHQRVRSLIQPVILFFLTCYAIATIATLVSMPHMLDPLLKQPLLFLFPTLSLLAIGNTVRQIRREKSGWAFLSSCASIGLLLSLFVIGNFPYLIHSTFNPLSNSLTIYNAASSHKTLGVLLIVVLMGIPLVLAYACSAYYIFRGKVKIDQSSY